MQSNQPTELSPRSSSSNEDQIDVQAIIQKSKKQFSDTLLNNSKHLSSESKMEENVEQNKNNDNGEVYVDGDDDLDQIQLEMLVEECEELIGKISPNIHNFYMQEETTVISDVDESFSMKKEKNRLEKQYIQLCLEIERQQKQLQNFRFKVQVAQKQAQYYGRQIKQKTAILENLEQHSKKGRQSLKKGQNL